MKTNKSLTKLVNNTSFNYNQKYFIQKYFAVFQKIFTPSFIENDNHCGSTGKLIDTNIMKAPTLLSFMLII